MRENDSIRAESMTVLGGTEAILDTGGNPGAGVAAAGPAPGPRDAADVAELVAVAAAASRPLRIVGAGTWLTAGRPVPSGARLDLLNLRGIVEYTPGDLTITALAGTPVAEIAATAAAHGQWLPLDPFGDPAGTLGATLATASAGPLGATVGRPRDVALGIEVVTGTGDRIRAGGRVVKNVAGFDLVRLQVGAWGSLGVITEATLRLRGRPETDATLALPVPDDAAQLSAILHAVRHLPQRPVAAELLDFTLARFLGLGGTTVLVVRLMGNEDAVRAQVRSLAALGDARDVPGEVWPRLARHETADASVLRISGAPSHLGGLWTAARSATADAQAAMHATVERGVVRISIDGGDDAAITALVRQLSALGASVIERAKPDARQAPPAGAVDRLSRGLREAFDPHGILNPGIMGTLPDTGAP
jgi:glycolate oxidase FAD binding subunit